MIKGYLLGKLNKPNSIPEQIIQDVNIAFMSGQDVFKLCLFDSIDNNPSLLDYVENCDNQSIEAELDLHLLYYEVVDAITNHYMWFNNVYVISQNKGVNKYLEIYRKNYNQHIDKVIK